MRLIVFLLAFTPLLSFADVFSQPETAILELENAYRSGDISRIMNARDFDVEAKFMLAKSVPILKDDEKSIAEVSATLKMAFEAQLKNDGIPNFIGLNCRLTNERRFTNGVVRYAEVCRFPDGGHSNQPVYAYKGARGWRFITYNE